jgi:glucose/arabinose dehydrogenase/cytochrome c553
LFKWSPVKRFIGMSRWVWVIVGLVLIAGAALISWTIASNNAESAKRDAVGTAVADALSAQDAARKLNAPHLLTPEDGVSLDNVAAAKLTWTWTRPLAEDEVFDVRVWQEGEPAYGIAWATEPSYDMTKWLLDRQPGEYFWTVTVMKKNADGTSGTEIADLAPQQHFTMSKINLNIMDVPEGFQAQLYARLPIPEPTVITFGADNAMYVLTLGGQILRVTDDDGDGTAENSTIIYGDDNDALFHAVGMTFVDDKIYVSYSGKIGIMEDADGDGNLDSVTPIVEGLPSWQHTFHSNNGIALGPDGKLYAAVGGTTDHGPLHDPLEASILRMNPDGSDLEVFASGFRNPYDLVFSPDGKLFTADNSPDEPDHDLQYLPPEEIDYVQQGKNYGFPTAYGNLRPDDSTEPPITELFTSSASSGITYYDADQFPPEYHGIFLAQFGSGSAYSKAAAVKTGEMVVFVQPQEGDDGRLTGTWEPFAMFRRDLGSFSPIDVTVGPDGALYIAEWQTWTIFRVTYTGEISSAEATETAVEATLEISDADAELRAHGEDLFRNGAEGAPACVTCHLLDSTATGTGPSLVGLSERAGSEVAGLSAEEYVRQSILSPNEHIVEGYTANFMFQNYAQVLSDDDVDALVAYVLSLRAR